MKRAAGPVARQSGEAQALPHHALPGESGVAVEQDREHGLAVLIALEGHHRAGLAEDDRVDRLEVRGVGQQRQMDFVAVELAVR